MESATAGSALPAKETARLDQLTSLRFFAAMMIVMLHATGSFGIQKSALTLNQGVAFFFVLSGFILTYVYPRLDSAPPSARSIARGSHASGRRTLRAS